MWVCVFLFACKCIILQFIINRERQHVVVDPVEYNSAIMHILHCDWTLQIETATWRFEAFFKCVFPMQANEKALRLHGINA